MTIIASGSEVHLALEVFHALDHHGIEAAVISMVSTQLFDEQDAAYRENLIPPDTLRVSIEAGTTFGWERYTGESGLNIGIDRFGASAPADALFEKFGLTAGAIVPQILNKLNS